MGTKNLFLKQKSPQIDQLASLDSFILQKILENLLDSFMPGLLYSAMLTRKTSV